MAEIPNIPSKPTLLVKGNLKETAESPKQAVLDEILPIDYIMNWFGERIPMDNYGSPKIPASSPLDKIMILQSSTGSGKSTIIPPYFYQLFFNRTKKNIAITQPRILTAIEISKNEIPPFNTREELNKQNHPSWQPIQFGFNIGVQTSIFQKRPIKGMIYMTSGILTQQLFSMDNKSFMDKYSLIVIDEAHERSIEIDLLLYMLKKFINNNWNNKNCPFLLIMSATIDTKLFADYLLSEVEKTNRYRTIIQVSGFSFPIEEHFLEYDSQNIYNSIVDQIKEIHKNNTEDFLNFHILKSSGFKIDEDLKETDLKKKQTFRDILVFIKGPKEIKKLKKMVNNLNSKDEFFIKYPVIPLGLTSELVESQSHEYRSAVERDIRDLDVEVFEFIKGKTKVSIKKPVRKIIFASNVAETGLTVKTLKYIIEPGFYYSSEFFPSFGSKVLISKPVTQSMHKQRKGRVGRKYPGICYSMFTQEVYDLMRENQYPDIIKKEITLDLLGILIREADPDNEINELSLNKLFGENSLFLKKINEKKIDILKLDLLDLPSTDSLYYSMEKLYILGAINSNSIPTRLGFIMNKFRFIPIESIKMILSGYSWNTSISDLITIASFLYYAKDLFIRDEEYKLQIAEKFGKFTIFPEEQIYKEKHILSYSKFKTDLIMADQFIKYLLIFQELEFRISQINVKNIELEKEEGITGSGDGKSKINVKLMGEKNIIDILSIWGEKFGINIKKILDVLELRDVIINLMCVIGLNPYHNHQKSYNNIFRIYNDNEMFEYISGLKQCIYEGYKLNLAVWNPGEKKYYSKKTHIPIQVNNDYILSGPDIVKYGDSNPKYIIFDELDFILGQNSEIYTARVKNISVMDGFVIIDPTFAIP